MMRPSLMTAWRAPAALVPPSLAYMSRASARIALIHGLQPHVPQSSPCAAAVCAKQRAAESVHDVGYVDCIDRYAATAVLARCSSTAASLSVTIRAHTYASSAKPALRSVQKSVPP